MISSDLANEKEHEILIHEIRIYSQDIGMTFDNETCAILLTKSGGKETAEGIKLPYEKNI